MGIITDLKFVETDKRFIQDKYVQALGGLNRIKQLLNMDKQFAKEINFYIKEIENTRFMDNPENINTMWVNLGHLVASVNKEFSFSTHLMNIARSENMNQELSIFIAVNSELIGVKAEIEKAVSKIKFWPKIKDVSGHLKTALGYLEKSTL